MSSGRDFDIDNIVDSPWRTTVGGADRGRAAGTAGWLYFGQEFQWIRSIANPDTPEEFNHESYRALIPHIERTNVDLEIEAPFRRDLALDRLADDQAAGFALGREAHRRAFRAQELADQQLEQAGGAPGPAREDLD